MKHTQKQWVIDQLQTYGEVTRNQALQHFISRLGAIVLVLKNEGYDLIAEQRGSDYVYKLATAPKKEPQATLKYDPVLNRMVRV